MLLPDLLLLLRLSLVSDRLLGQVLSEEAGSLALDEVVFAILSVWACIVAAGWIPFSTCVGYSLNRSTFFGEREEECSIVATVLHVGLD